MITCRTLEERDMAPVLQGVDGWCGGRPMADRLPRPFFRHFADTSLVLEEDGRLIGVLVGFLSQSRPGVATVHRVAVHPAYRRRGLGTLLYDQFRDRVRARGAHMIETVTAPDNHGALAFLRALGLTPVAGDAGVNGWPVGVDGDGHGGARVLWQQTLPPPPPSEAGAALQRFTIGVKVIIEDPTRRVLLERLSYAAGWHLPGGGVQAGESVYDAARREVAEECGIAIADLALVAVLYHPQEGRDDHVVVLAAPYAGDPAPVPDHTEVVDLQWVSPGTLPPEVTPGTRRLLEAFWTGKAPGPSW